MLCKSCNQLLSIGEKFCSNCGTKIDRNCFSFSLDNDQAQMAFSLIQSWLNEYNYKFVEENM